jgi:hypothetical protein
MISAARVGEHRSCHLCLLLGLSYVKISRFSNREIRKSWDFYSYASKSQEKILSLFYVTLKNIFAK